MSVLEELKERAKRIYDAAEPSVAKELSSIAHELISFVQAAIPVVEKKAIQDAPVIEQVVEKAVTDL